MKTVVLFCLVALAAIVVADHNADHAKQLVKKINNIGEWKAKVSGGSESMI